MVENNSAELGFEELKKQFEKLEKKSRRTELLLSVNRKISGLTDLNTILFNIIEFAGKIKNRLSMMRKADVKFTSADQGNWFNVHYERKILTPVGSIDNFLSNCLRL